MRPLRLLIPPAMGRTKSFARADVLGSEFTRWLGMPVEVEVAASYADLESRLLGGEVDLAWAPPAVCARVVERSHAIFKAVRNGRSTYRAAIVAHRGEARDLADLEGRRAVWPDPLSTAGFLLPDAYLRSHGFDPSTFFSSQRFVGSYQAALAALIAREAEVTSIYVHDETASDLRETIRQHTDRPVDDLVAVAVTGEVGSDGLVVSGRMAPEIGQVVVERLVGMQSQPGRPPLAISVFDAEALELASSSAYRSLL